MHTIVLNTKCTVLIHSMTADYRSTLSLDADRARKHGLDEFVQANPCRFDHADLFKTLQTLTLDYRLNDAYTCLVGEPLQ